MLTKTVALRLVVQTISDNETRLKSRSPFLFIKFWIKDVRLQSFHHTKRFEAFYLWNYNNKSANVLFAFSERRRTRLTVPGCGLVKRSLSLRYSREVKRFTRVVKHQKLFSQLGSRHAKALKLCPRELARTQKGMNQWHHDI